MASMHESHKAVKRLESGLRRLIATGFLLAACSLSMRAQVSVTTWRNDIGRTGQNLNETILNTSDVNATQFGKLFSQTVDGYVYAQPLYLPNVTIGGQSHNVVFIATEHDSVYAFDADNNGGANANPLWFASMLTPAYGAATGATTVSSGYVGTDISPEVGITGTPVIDPTTGTLYVVSATLEGSSFVQRLHALDITSGAEKFGGPTVLNASVLGTGNGSVNGVLGFDPEWENQRPGLLLLNGIVYIGFASHGDNGPWHGWILAYSASTLQQTGAFCATHNGVGAGMWMGGAGLAADLVDPVNHPFGRIFVATGNGDYTASTPYTNNMDFGDSILNLDLTNGVPSITDEFTPYDQANLDQYDSDVASGGVMVLPNQTSGNNTHLLAQTGKSGTLYLLNRENLGGYGTSSDNVVQSLQNAVGMDGAWSTPGYWNGTVYYWGVNDMLKEFPVVKGLLTGPTIGSSETYGYPGANPSISANGNTQGIIWSIESDGYKSQAPAVLQAHAASGAATTLYSSATNGTRDNPGAAVKFTVPTVVNGKVYVGAEGQISVFGLLNGQQVAAAPLVSPIAQSFNGTLMITITDTTPGAIIYYTQDGTTPTTSSPVYTSPITLTASATIQALASAPGYLQSAVTTEAYVDSSQVSTPLFSPGGGTYTQPELVTITESTTGATIYYTTDGSMPTTSSPQYTGPVLVSGSETLNATAVASGFANSLEASATYVLNIGQTGINFPDGFAGTASVVIENGSTQLNDSRLQLTSGVSDQAGSAWYYQQVNVQAFTTEFSFQLSNPTADGMTFAIQGQNLAALGQYGEGLGYQGIPSSIAVKFDLFSNVGEGPDSTGLYINGAVPTLPAIDMSNTGIDLHSDDTMDVVFDYNGTILSMTITDIVTQASYTTSWTVNIPAIVGGNTAWVGFTGATGGGTSSQKIETWTYSVGSKTPPVLTPSTFSPPAGTYTSAQSVTISNATAGTTIYYTTDGSTPTTSSSVYTSPITVSTTETLSAIAAETGYTNSPVATAAYTLGTAMPAPTISPAGGTFSTAQTVTITDSTAGATIYYTTNGTTPTTSSSVYSGSLTVSSTETIEAIAVKSGLINSPITTVGFVIDTTGTVYINYPAGSFTAGTLDLISGASTPGGLLELTDGGSGENHAAWFATTVPITSFITDFNFQQLNANADGMTFAIQNYGPTALGGSGGSLGYQGIPTSIAVKFDLFSNAGEGSDSTGLYLNGASPTVPSVDLTSTPINLHSGDVMHAHMVYDGTNLTMTLTDTVTNGSVTEVFPVNIPAAVGGNSAYVGFTGGTGGSTATQNVLSWTYVNPAGLVAVSPTFTPPAGTYATSQSVTLNDTTSGAAIYYTTNGTTPTTSSTLYTGPITVSASETLQAIASESGYLTSPPASATYTIGGILPVPTFSIPGGAYTSAQTVTISEATAGTTVYYTTNGTMPTTSSAVYSGPITVNTSETLEAIAVKAGYTNSAAATATYTLTITSPAATPTFSVAAGTYTYVVTVALSDTTPGATIYYTQDGTTPTTSSLVYKTGITVSATETIKAIAVATGYTTSAMASAAYTITSTLPTPTFSPVAGTYTSSQTVTISDAAGATIYYTTNGTTPTTSSSVYSGPIAVSASETLEAVGIETGYTNSPVASGAYSINTASTTYISYPTGNFAASAFTLNGSPTVTTGGLLQITDGGTGEDRAAWFTTKVPVQTFVTDFTFQQLNATADGMTFTIQGQGTNAYGSGGGGLGYQNIPTSAAVKFDLYSNAGEGSDSTGLYTNGAIPTVPAIDMTSSGVNLHSGDVMHAHMVYDGTNLTMTLTDTVTNATVTEVFPVNIPSLVGGNSAWVGFTGGTGGSTSTQNILTWTYVSPSVSSAAAPTFSPAAGAYTSSQSVTIGDTTAGATLYYTTNGNTPTTSSSIYSGPISVSASQTVQAIAAATGYTNSSVASAAYTIGATLPPPTFSPVAGPYTTAQTVAISDTTPGTTIYYTTNGNTPNPSTGLYTGPITVSASQTVQAIAVETGYTTSSIASAAYTIGATLPTPTFTPAAGPYTTSQSVTIGNAPAGATVYYTTNGTLPTTSSSVYSGPITVSSSQTVKALAVETGYLNSAVASAAYTIGATLPPPTFSPAAGPYTTSQTVTISDATAGTTIYYTTNGNTPNPSTGLYTGPITVTSSQTVQAIAVETGYTTSSVASAAYTIGATLPVPTFSPAAGPYTASQSVSISEATAGATVYYTTNGTTPTTSSTVYSGPITVGTTETLESIAVETGYINSLAGTAAYTITLPAATPAFSVPAGTYTSAQTVTITDGTPSATIYYTTNGTTPTTSSAVYSGPITVSISETLSAIATATGYSTSSLASATYTINGTTQAAAPTFSPGGGTYNLAQTVTISDTTPGATIYFSLNGSTPTTSSTKYTAPVKISNTYTLQAIAVATGYTNSTVTSAPYTLVASTPVISPASGTYAIPLTVTITSATTTAGIFYTTNGSTPTGASTKYTGPFTLSAGATVKAIAGETGFTTSSAASAVYTLQTGVATPTFSVPSGSYTSAQTVSISDTTAGATIYYTTNGTTPTTSSNVYGGPITVSTSETLEAIGVAAGDLNSPVNIAPYTISTNSASYINYTSGQFTAGSLTLNNGATVTSGGVLQLTDGGSGENRTAWFNTKVPVQAFTTDFTFQQLSATADGMTFAIQGQSLTAAGGNGGGLGYQNIPTSVAVKFDLFSNSTEGNDSTGLYTNGASPTVPSTDLTSTGVNLHSGDPMHAHIVYDGTNLTMTLTDVMTSVSATEVYPVNIPSLVGANTAWVGFTGGTGGSTAIQNVLSWTYLVP